MLSEQTTGGVFNPIVCAESDPELKLEFKMTRAANRSASLGQLNRPFNEQHQENVNNS